MLAGISASLTGQFAVPGRQALAGLSAWAEYVNGCGDWSPDGRRRHPITLCHYDDASLADNARRNTERLLRQDGVDLLFGPYSAGLTAAAAEVSEQYGRILWNHGGAGAAVYRRGYRHIIGILTPADCYLAGLPALARAANPDARTLAITRVDAGAFARQVGDGAEAAAQSLGFTTLLRQTYPPTTTDFAGIAAAIAAAAPDALVAVGRIRHDIALAQTLAGLRPRPRIGLAAVVAAPIADFAAALGPDADGFVGPSQWEPQTASAAPDYGPPPAVVMEMLERAARSASVPVDYPMAQACAAGLVAQRCIEYAGGLDDDAALRDAAGRLDFTTFYGRFRIDAAGRQIGRTVALIQRHNGRKIVIWPPKLADGELRGSF